MHDESLDTAPRFNHLSKALPGKHDIKAREPSILYISTSEAPDSVADELVAYVVDVLVESVVDALVESVVDVLVESVVDALVDVDALKVAVVDDICGLSLSV